MTEAEAYKATATGEHFNVFSGARLLGSFTGFDENENGLFMWLDSETIDAVYIDDITKIVEI
jgi:hypothetical protein